MYRRDGQRNISALIDSIGNFVVKYEYDAWGHKVLNGSEVENMSYLVFEYVEGLEEVIKEYTNITIIDERKL